MMLKKNKKQKNPTTNKKCHKKNQPKTNQKNPTQNTLCDENCD